VFRGTPSEAVVRVLIVDDHYSVRRGVRALLLLGAEDVEICGEAQDGREAVTKAGELKPDLIIMDVRMPVLDGFHATRAIRHRFPGIQIILLSLHDSPEAREESVRAGAFEFVEKSAIWTKLLPTLRRLQASGVVPHEPSSVTTLPAPPPKIPPTIAFRDAEQRFLSTFEQTAVGMAHFAENGRWLRVNQKLCDMLGFSSGQLQRLRFQDLINPADLEIALAQATKVASGEFEHYAMNTRYLRHDGESVPIRLNVDAVRDPKGNLRYYNCVIQDDTSQIRLESELTKTQQALQIATQQLDLLSHQIKAPLTRCSRDLRYLWVNQYYADWLHRPLDKIVGRPILDVVGKEALQKLQSRFDRVLSGSDVDFSDIIVYDGIGPRSISAAYRPTLDSAHAVDGWIAFVQDLTGKSEP